jgi:serine protease Do
MIRRSIFICLVFFLGGALCFGQAGALRDYVGLISIRYHPDVIAYMGKFKETFEKRGYTDAARAVDNYLKGLSGSGFIYVAADGACYVLTNEHVVAQSDSLSITFEKQDGAKTTYERLKVLHVDEEKDLAILVFEDGRKPFTGGLSFRTAPVDEGTNVFAAGFPGLANTAVWQFSSGMVSNASVRIPVSSDSNETIGPYIQHTAQIDPGNSGGPLLAAAAGVPTGYAVIGINTLSAIRRQAANYAIPVNQITAFINTALSNEPVNERELINKKVDDFMKGLRTNSTVYGHIAQYLSYVCTAANAEYAVSELLDKASRTVQRNVLETFGHDPVEGMNAAVAWLIENSMRGNSVTIKIDLDSITSNDKGGFDVVFNVNDRRVKSEWIKEYGVYRMETFGDTVAGNKVLLDEKQKKRAQDQALKTDYILAVSASYAHIISDSAIGGPAINASLILLNPFNIGIDLNFGLNGEKYFHAGLFVGYTHPIRLNTVALMPFGALGLAYEESEGSKKEESGWDSDVGFPFTIAIKLKAGLMVTTAAVPGLFGRVFYEFDLPFIEDQNKSIKNHHIIGITVGYGF